MTMHSSKGLEFPCVYLVGFEDGLFPGMRAIGDYEEMEEERRLCYVAITRAKEYLSISYAKQRMLYGKTTAALPSRFLKEIPEDVIVRKGGYHIASSAYTRTGTEYGNTPKYQSQKPVREFSNTVSVSTQKASISVNKGDMIQHTAFGKGMILSVIKMGNDALLEIAFDRVGTKKLMLNAASAHMKRL